MLDSEEKTGLSFQLLASSVDHSSLALIGSSVRDAVGFTQLSVSRQLIFTVLNAKYVHPRPALLTDPFYKCNVITNVKNSCREITTTYLSAGHIESEAAGWKSGRLHCSLPRSDKSSSRSRLCWLRNNIYFPSAALRGNIPATIKITTKAPNYHPCTWLAASVARQSRAKQAGPNISVKDFMFGNVYGRESI